MNQKTRFLRLAGCIALLWIVYGVIYQYLLRSDHAVTSGVRWLLFSDMPIFILHLAMIVAIIAAFVNPQKFSEKMMLGAVFGYGLGFVSAVIFNVDLPPPSFAPPESPPMSNNAWFVWLITFLAFVAAAAVWETVLRHRKKK